MTIQTTDGPEVLWVEDVQAAVRGATLRLELKTHPGIARIVDSVRSAERAFEERPWRFVIMDLRLPLESGDQRELLVDAGKDLITRVKMGRYGKQNIKVP